MFCLRFALSCGRLMYDLDMRSATTGDLDGHAGLRGGSVFGFSQHAFRRTVQVVNARFGVTVGEWNVRVMASGLWLGDAWTKDMMMVGS